MIEITKDNINKGLLKNFISENFKDINKKIRLFNFFGLEIIEDSDLKNFYSCLIRHKIIFFTRNNENFEKHKIKRVFKTEKKLGEVIFKKLLNFYFKNNNFLK